MVSSVVDVLGGVLVMQIAFVVRRVRTDCSAALQSYAGSDAVVAACTYSTWTMPSGWFTCSYLGIEIL
jgi:uncharacterized protein (DUF697 family)